MDVTHLLTRKPSTNNFGSSISNESTYVPAGDPGCKRRPVLAGELGAPVVEPAGGRVGGADLGHGQRHTAIERRHDQPPERHGHRPAVAQPGVVCRRDAHQHGDDGEGEGGVGRHAEPALELLLVPELLQPGPVRFGRVVGAPSRRHLPISRADQLFSFTCSLAAWLVLELL